ncbi:MAG: hypothetical protein JKY77_00730 [Rhizobiaceae bacterium]|nr:hypothetical protein [Rhizobiaceae bacterium]
MEQLIQLKEMLASARTRLEKNPDYKLVNSLEGLIADLEVAFGPIDDAVEQSDAETTDEPVEEASDEETAPSQEFQVEETPDTISEAPVIIATTEIENQAEILAETQITDALETAFAEPAIDETVEVAENLAVVEAAHTTDALASQLVSALNEMVEPASELETLEATIEADVTEEDADPFNATGIHSGNGSGLPIN